MERKLYGAAVLLAFLGLLSLTVPILTKSAYPDMLFRILLPVGLLLVVISLGLFALDWLLRIKKELELKKYLSACILALLGILFVVLHVV